MLGGEPARMHGLVHEPRVLVVGMASEASGQYESPAHEVVGIDQTQRTIGSDEDVAVVQVGVEPAGIPELVN